MASDQLDAHVDFAVKDLVDPKEVYPIDFVCMLFLNNFDPCFEFNGTVMLNDGYCGGCQF